MNKKFPVIFFICFVSIAIFGLGLSIYKRSKDKVYTVGTVKEIWKPVKGVRQVSFTYHLYGKMYESSSPLEEKYDENKIIGNKFLMFVPEGFPGDGAILLEYPLKDSVRPPKNGWEKNPLINKD